MEHLLNTPWLILIIAALTGYLTGSLSFARIITRIVTKSGHINKISTTVPGTDLTFESDSISATVVNQNLGKRYGCLTALFDLTKVAIPTLIIFLIFKKEPYYLLTALTGLLGHNYPLYYRFKGGRGESPMIGAMLVINWFGILITNAAALILGYLTGSVLVSRYGWYILMIPWYWYYFKNYWYVSFMIGANILFWLAMSGDLKRYARLKRENDLNVSEETVSEFLLMGKGFGRFLDHYGFPALLKKLFSGKSPPPESDK